jgi:hypothetical protein
MPQRIPVTLHLKEHWMQKICEVHQESAIPLSRFLEALISEGFHQFERQTQGDREAAWQLQDHWNVSDPEEDFEQMMEESRKIAELKKRWKEQHEQRRQAPAQGTYYY